MALNYIWSSFILIAFIFGLYRYFALDEVEIFGKIITSLFDNAKTGFELSIGLTGVMCLWLGLMKMAEKAGMIEALTRLVNPVFAHFFPSIPKNHPSIGFIMLNFSANLLGLDNAATPIGLKAMQSLQELNSDKDTASNAQIMFLVLNTSGLTLIPVSVLMYRTQMGAANPADVFFPILLATFLSTLAGLIAVAIYQKINMLNRFFLFLALSVSTIFALLVYFLTSLSQTEIQAYSGQMGQFILLLVVVLFVGTALFKRLNGYDVFIEGAKEGFQTAIMIIPYLVAILIAIGAFRASGAMDLLVGAIASFFEFFNLDSGFVHALPTAMMKPLSGSGARGLMIDTMKQFGADSFPARVACTIQGSTDTTFYILAVMFGSVGVRKMRHAIVCGLIADFVGIVSAIILSYYFFG